MKAENVITNLKFKVMEPWLSKKIHLYAYLNGNFTLLSHKEGNATEQTFYVKTKRELCISTLWVTVYGTVIPREGSCDSL